MQRRLLIIFAGILLIIFAGICLLLVYIVVLHSVIGHNTFSEETENNTLVIRKG